MGAFKGGAVGVHKGAGRVLDLTKKLFIIRISAYMYMYMYMCMYMYM